EEGCGWQRIPHVFQWPFYAIDYALAQVCALQYCRWMKQDAAAAWQSYLDFCRRTGTLTFPELVRAAGLEDPFAEDTLAGLVDWLERSLM
ncbi:MAG: M3 family oligoendopeptidase, partial [Candidatus Fimadaptatus sp.]